MKISPGRVPKRQYNTAWIPDVNLISARFVDQNLLPNGAELSSRLFLQIILVFSSSNIQSSNAVLGTSSQCIGAEAHSMFHVLRCSRSCTRWTTAMTGGASLERGRVGLAKGICKKKVNVLADSGDRMCGSWTVTVHKQQPFCTFL